MKDHTRRIKAIDKKLFSDKKEGPCIIMHYPGETQEALDRRVRELREENIKLYGSCGLIIILNHFTDPPNEDDKTAH